MNKTSGAKSSSIKRSINRALRKTKRIGSHLKDDAKKKVKLKKATTALKKAKENL